jgi:hypothetical protein
LRGAAFDQVGSPNVGGLPVSRERRAFEDLMQTFGLRAHSILAVQGERTLMGQQIRTLATDADMALIERESTCYPPSP